MGILAAMERIEITANDGLTFDPDLSLEARETGEDGELLDSDRKIIFHTNLWRLIPFTELRLGARFVPQAQLVELIDRELAKEPTERRPAEAMIAPAVYRRIPPISLGEGQVRNAVLEPLQSWCWFAADQAVIYCGSSDYLVDQVRAFKQDSTANTNPQAELFPLETQEGV